MRRILGAVALLLILVAAWAACQDRRKDKIPTQIQPLPKGEPQPFDNPSRE